MNKSASFLAARYDRMAVPVKSPFLSAELYIRRIPIKAPASKGPVGPDPDMSKHLGPQLDPPPTKKTCVFCYGHLDLQVIRKHQLLKPVFKILILTNETHQVHGPCLFCRRKSWSSLNVREASESHEFWNKLPASRPRFIMMHHVTPNACFMETWPRIFRASVKPTVIFVIFELWKLKFKESKRPLCKLLL